MNPLKEIVTGRRRQWNRISRPMMEKCVDVSKQLAPPISAVMEHLIFACWTIFRGDFIEGEFKAYLKRLTAVDFAYLFRVYLTRLIGYLAISGAWADLAISEDAIWMAAERFLPGCDQYRRDIEARLGPLEESRTKPGHAERLMEISKLYRPIVHVLEGRGIADRFDPTDADSPVPPYDVFFLKLFYFRLLRDTCETLMPALAEAVASGRR